MWFQNVIRTVEYILFVPVNRTPQLHYSLNTQKVSYSEFGSFNYIEFILTLLKYVVRCSVGLQVVIDVEKPAGQRVQSVYARCGSCTVPIYKKLNLNDNYTIIMSKYLASGGDGHKFKTFVFQNFSEYSPSNTKWYRYIHAISQWFSIF